jgi:hypothetical protein
MNAANAIHTAAATVVVGAAFAAAANPAPITRAPLPVLQSPNVPRPTPQNPKQLPGGTPHHEQYTALEFTVWTGDDDLRWTSTAAVKITFPEGAFQCVLHDYHDDGWGNNSKHQGRQCVLPGPKHWNQLRAAKMMLVWFGDNNDPNLGETSDNWNVNRVSVKAIDSADKLYPCLLDVAGAPLVRMSSILTSYDLTETENRC